ncbi:MAG TPA: serine protease [Methyloceanibacter sp.]|nr:serine protease [Methyloceanibacter sp.]
MRQGLGVGLLAAIMVAIVSYAVDASPHVSHRSPAEPVAAQISLLHRVLIYAKEGSRKLVDGRWNLAQSEAKLGLKFSAEETRMACTGRIVCRNGGGEVFASASSVLRPDLVVTAKHVFSEKRGGAVSLGRCSFRSYLHRNVAIPIEVEKDQRKGYFLNNEDFIVVRLKRGLRGCSSFAINGSDTSLSEGEEVFSVTARQRRMLNKISDREPLLAKGTIRSASKGVAGGPPFYYADIDLDEGGSGGAVFALKGGRPVTDDDGYLILRGILVAVGPRGRSGKPYSEERNYTIVVGLQAEFRDLVQGKAQLPVALEPAPCLEDEVAEITVISESVPEPPPQTLAPFLQQDACSREAGKANDSCVKLAKELKELAKGIEKLSGAWRGQEKRQFKLRNDTSCPICFTYERCNDFGCWDKAVRASGKSTLFAGVRAQAPKIKNAQFCKSGRSLAGLGPPLPPRKPEHSPTDVAEFHDHNAAPEAMFAAAQEKAKRQGVHMLTAEDIRGLSLGQIRALRGY